MRHILAILVFIGVIAISFTIGPVITNPTGFIIDEGELEGKIEIPNFRVYTKAECENISDYIFCHDEIFASCGGIEYWLPNNENLGSGIFPQDWEDPRYN